MASQASLTPQGPAWLDIVERIGKLASIIAIPIVIPLALASYSAKVQQTSQKETINRDYVQLAVSILTQKKDDAAAPLRDWAVDLLAEHSPTKFKPEVVAALKSGTISLPEVPSVIESVSNVVPASSPDGNKVAKAYGRNVEITDKRFPNGSAAGFIAPIDALQFAPDSTLLAIATRDGNAYVLNTDTRLLLSKLIVNSRILGMHFDSTKQLRISTADAVSVYDLDTGQLLRKSTIPPSLDSSQH
jgi:hypothetical protein